MHRRTLLSLCAGSLGITGCVANSSSSNTNSPSETESSTPTPTPTPAESVTPYQSLTTEGKDFFRNIHKNGPIVRPIDKIPTAIWDAKHIRYSGETYAIQKTDTGRFIAEYSVRVSRESESEVNTANVVEFSDLSEDAQDVFTQARTDGPYTTRDATPSKPIREERTIQYDDSYYSLSVPHADLRVWKLSTENVSE